MQDYIIRATAGNGSVRVFVATTKNLAGKARELHQTTPVATAALGRLLTAASIMGATLKNDSDIITLIIKGDGPIGGIVATTNNQSQVKGYVFQPHVILPKNNIGKLDVGGAVGSGTLAVSKDLGLKEPVSGQVALVSGEIAEDITYYFAVSEQTPSSVALGVLVDVDYSVKQAGGYIIQVMPDADEAVLAHLEKHLPTLPSITTLLDEGNTPEDILALLFEGHDTVIYDKIYPAFACSCSLEKTRKVLLNVGLDELKLILEEDKGANLHCHFCNTDYYFDEDAIQEMIAGIEKQ
ncbi:MAG: Hsp33 family molecular chaperone HslO [Defluviitaleaceae bacterium]|nr:Hsp33 family molecular chaperone HslO [Defluviitaleaceae bacterium]